MEIQSIRRTAYWIGLFVFITILALTMTGSRLHLSFKVLVVVLLGLLSAMFKFEELFSFLSIVISCIMGIFAGAVLASTAAEFWAIAFIFVLVYFIAGNFLSKENYRKLIGL